MLDDVLLWAMEALLSIEFVTSYPIFRMYFFQFKNIYNILYLNGVC